MARFEPATRYAARAIAPWNEETRSACEYEWPVRRREEEPVEESADGQDTVLTTGLY
jgi:hypothetical protein